MEVGSKGFIPIDPHEETDVAMNKLIRASAGSGKTYQLSGHFLRQLFLQHRPETILATTFTRKAAGEILGRVLTRLAEAATKPEEAAKLAQALDLPQVTTADASRLLTELTHNLHRLRVCTLDSFFQQVARSLTLELGLPPGWSIVDEHLDRELREQAIDAVLSQHVPQDAQQLMHMLAKGRSKRSVRDLIDDTVSNYHDLFLMTDDAAWDKLHKPRRLTIAEREQLISDLYAAPLPTDARFIKGRAEDIERFRKEDWDDFIDTGIANKVLTGENKYWGKPLDDEVIQIYQRLLSHAQAELVERLANQMKAIRSLMVRFDREYSRLRADHGWLRFGDVTRVLSRSAGAASGSRMSFRLDSSIRNLLLDEFQDTSSDQWQILRRLATNLQAVGKQSSFFCVGDGKQAIYGWRGGVAAILDAVPEAVPDIEQVPLDKSRRSSPAVMETVNKVFEHVASHPALDEYADACSKWSSEFPHHSTAYETMPGYACFRTSPSMAGEGAEERRGPWFRWIAEQIREQHQQCRGAEIGVLTRKNSTVARLVHELNSLGVPASEEGGTPPTDSPAVLATMSLLHFASHPACRISRFHIATSPLGAVIGLNSWRDDHQASVAAAMVRARLMDDGYGRTLQWLSEAVRPSCSSRDILRMAQIVSEGWRFDATGSLNASDFVRLLENSKFQKSEPAPVRVMTIHQSKGLEFDIVFLPELDGILMKAPQAAFSSPSVADPPDRVCVWSNKSVRKLLPPDIQQAFDDTIARQVSESLCVFYVALTRARYALHLLSQPISGKRVPKTYAGLLLASLTDQSQALPESTLFETGSADWFTRIPDMQRPTVRKRSAGEQIPHVPLASMPDGRRRGLQRRAPSRHDETRLYLPDVSAIMKRESAPATKTRTVDPRVRGTLMHAWFECIEWLNDSDVPDVEQLHACARRLTISEETVKKVLPDFLRMLQSPEIRSVFDQRTAGLAPSFSAHMDVLRSQQAILKVDRERPFVMIRNGEIIQGSIDRLVRLVLHGRTLAADVVDFKTDRLVGDVARWVREKQEHYAPQLEEYRNAVQKCWQLPPEHISTRLLLLEAGRVTSTQ